MTASRCWRADCAAEPDALGAARHLRPVPRRRWSRPGGGRRPHAAISGSSGRSRCCWRRSRKPFATCPLHHAGAAGADRPDHSRSRRWSAPARSASWPTSMCPAAAWSMRSSTATCRARSRRSGTAGGKVAHFERVEWHDHPGPRHRRRPRCSTARSTGGSSRWSTCADAAAATATSASRSTRSGRACRLMRASTTCSRRSTTSGSAARCWRRWTRRTTCAPSSATTQKLWQHLPQPVPRGTPYGTGRRPGADGPRDLDGGRGDAEGGRLCRAEGRDHQPDRLPAIGPLGQVTADLLQQIGMNVDLQEMDWGTVVQRRASREPVEKGGWSIFHTTGSSPGFSIMNPAGPRARSAAPAQRGWFRLRTAIPPIEELTAAWLVRRRARRSRNRASPRHAARRKLAAACPSCHSGSSSSAPPSRGGRGC